MNIFILDADPELCARYHFDTHVVKMNVEYAQILSTVNRLAGINEGYEKISNPGTGVVQWAHRSLSNWLWLRDLATALNQEYIYRYMNPLGHPSYKITKKLSEPPIKDIGMTRPHLGMPIKYHQNNFVQAYRDYYMGDKKHLAAWRRRTVPNWWIEWGYF